jgi:hypothetical protein
VKFLFYIILIGWPLLGSAQILDNSQGNAFSNKPFFNATFIAKNNIQSIKGRFNYKKSGKPMYETEFYYVYNFNDKGQLINTFETKKDDGSVDTTWNEYIYNDAGRLMEHKQGTRTGKTSIYYQFDEKGRIVAEDHKAESVDSLGNLSVVVLNSELIKYEDYGLQHKKTTLNSYGLPYKSEMIYYDENGYLLEKEERFIRTGKTNKQVFEYNEKGYLVKKLTYEGSAFDPSEEVQYVYDEFGNLFEKHEYKDGVYISETQIVYNEKTKLMTAIIIRDVKTDFLMVIRFGSYSYFEK